MQGPVRRLMLGTCAAFVSLSLVLVYFLNPPGDRQALGLNAAYFSASYLMLCGHTHGGECDLAFFGTPFAPMKDKRYVRGLHPWKDR
jgi:hypothetical protein